MRQQQIILMTVVMFMFLIFIAAGGYYYTTTLEEETEKKTGSCSGTDANGLYEYDDDGNCVFKGCKLGYALEGGYCIKQLDYTADMRAGNIPVNCEIGGYIEGHCVDEFGRQLTGESGRCGTGMKTFTADPSAFSMANTLGECENYTYTESCEVPCRTLDCNATDDNYTKTDGVCRGLDGNPIGGDTNRCGSGYQIFEVDPATVGNFATDELRDAWIAENWKDCTPLKKPCSVVCETGMESSGCPDLSDGDFETSYVMDNNGLPACLEKDLAVSILKGEVPYQRDYHPMKILSRQEAKNKGITMDTLPEGYRILYRTGVTDFSDFNAKGCDTAVLEPCSQPTTNENCTLRTDVIKACYPVGCGQLNKKDIQVVVEEDAWGSGTCDMSKLVQDTVDCTEERSPECCSPDKEIHWVTDNSATCESDGKRFMRQNNCSMLGLDPKPTKKENCCYISPDYVSQGCNQDNQFGKEKFIRTVVNCGPDVSSVKYEDNNKCDWLYGVKTMSVHQLAGNGQTRMKIYYYNSDDTEYSNPREASLSGMTYNGEKTWDFDNPVIVYKIEGDVYDNSGGSAETYGRISLKDENGDTLVSYESPMTKYGGSKPNKVWIYTTKPGHETPNWTSYDPTP